MKRYGGGALTVPSHLEVTVRDLLALTDSARFAAEKAGSGDRASTANTATKDDKEDRSSTSSSSKSHSTSMALAPVMLTQPHFDELLGKMLMSGAAPRNDSFYKQEETIGTFEQM